MVGIAVKIPSESGDVQAANSNLRCAALPCCMQSLQRQWLESILAAGAVSDLVCVGDICFLEKPCENDLLMPLKSHLKSGIHQGVNP